MSKKYSMACKFYLAGKRTLSHTECPMVHKPLCWYDRTYGTCKNGRTCVYPHTRRDGLLVPAQIQVCGPRGFASLGAEQKAGDNGPQLSGASTIDERREATGVATSDAIAHRLSDS